MAMCGKINGKLIPMKIVMFGWFAAYACAIPFLTVHMKSLGLTVKETAVVYTLLPITQFLSSPIAGFIADRLGKYRNMLLLSIFMIIVLATALLYVPPIIKNDILKINLCSLMNIDNICSSGNVQTFNSSMMNWESCNITCNNLTHSVSFNKTMELVDIINSHQCDQRFSISHTNDTIFTSVCETIESNFTSNCSIICSGMNSTSALSAVKLMSSHHLTFWLYTILRIFYNIFSAIGFTLVNSSAIALTETDTQMGEYGRQRLWGMLGMAVFSPISGVLIDIISIDGVINYGPAFHTHNVLSLLTAIAVWYLDFEMEDAPKSYTETFRNFWLIIRSPSIVFLLIVVFWLGTMWGFLESFLFWFLDELNSPAYLLGLTITVGSVVGVPFLHFARTIMSKVGHVNLLSIAVFMYFVRCVGCSFLYNPWYVMPFEVLEIFTYHLMWVAAATYAAHLSPPGLLATIQGFIEGVHYGVGLGSGSLIGGTLMSTYGSRRALQIMGAISGAVALTYCLLHFFWLRKEVVVTRGRKASIKSFGSQRQGRKESSLSAADVNGTALSFVMQPTVMVKNEIKHHT